MYADDMILLAETVEELQNMLNSLLYLEKVEQLRHTKNGFSMVEN